MTFINTTFSDFTTLEDRTLKRKKNNYKIWQGCKHCLTLGTNTDRQIQLEVLRAQRNDCPIATSPTPAIVPFWMNQQGIGMQHVEAEQQHYIIYQPIPSASAVSRSLDLVASELIDSNTLWPRLESRWRLGWLQQLTTHLQITDVSEQKRTRINTIRFKLQVSVCMWQDSWLHSGYFRYLTITWLTAADVWRQPMRSHCRVARLRFASRVWERRH